VRAPDNLKIAILAGGIGSRLAEETELKPKPMVEIGGRPILWHILKRYASYGHREFFIALGYKGDEIKLYFLDRARLSGDMSSCVVHAAG
jgi:glucose-1-phosphate cytidylyltransferase